MDLRNIKRPLINSENGIYHLFFFFPLHFSHKKNCVSLQFFPLGLSMWMLLIKLNIAKVSFFSISYINRPNVFIKQNFLEETATTKKQITLVSCVYTESHISWEHLFANQILTTFFHFFFSPSLAWLFIQCIMKSDFHFLRLLYHFSFKSFFSQPISVPAPQLINRVHILSMFISVKWYFC